MSDAYHQLCQPLRRRGTTTNAASTTTVSSAATSGFRCVSCMRTKHGLSLSVSRRAYLSPRTIAFRVRLAVHRVTGEIRVRLHSVTPPISAGRSIRCSATASSRSPWRGLGWALVENMVHDDEGHMVNPQLRELPHPHLRRHAAYRHLFADTIDLIGPLGAKSQGECGINPVARLSRMREPTPRACVSPICRSPRSFSRTRRRK